MKRLFVSAVLSVVALLGVTLDSQAGLFRKHRGGCDSGCGNSASDCGYASAPCATAPAAAPQYVEQQVTRYRQVWVPKEVEVIVCKPVTSVEKFTYQVQVPVTRQVTRTETFFTTAQKEVTYSYTVCTPVMATEKRQETFYTSVQKQVPYTYTELVPQTVQRTVKQTTYQCVPQTITEMRPVCRIVPVTCTDACGNCITRCQRVTEMVPCTRTIVNRVPVTTDVVINQVICNPVTKQGTRTVCELVPQTREVTVNVCRTQMETRQGTRLVCVSVPQTRNVVVNVCSFNTETREGTRQVCHIVQEKVKQTVQVCQTQAYQETVRVPVAVNTSYSGCGAPACDNCGGGGRHGHHGR